MPISPQQAEDLPQEIGELFEGSLQELNRFAEVRGATALAVCSSGEDEVDVVYAWRAPGNRSPHAGAAFAEELGRVLANTLGPVRAGSNAAHALSTLISGAQSFLLIPWRRAKRCVFTLVLGFATADPGEEGLPQAISECLDFVVFAHWSLHEVTRMRAEVTQLNERLSARKIVERAKGWLQAQYGLSEEQAYEQLRRKSRQRRVTLATVSEELLRAESFRRQGA